MAPAGGAPLGGPEGAVGGGCTAGGSEAFSGCPHSDMATPREPRRPRSSRSPSGLPRRPGREPRERKEKSAAPRGRHRKKHLLPARETGSPEKPRGAPAEGGGAG